MTKTGYSCSHCKSRCKPRCTTSVSFYCELTGKDIQPMSCYRECASFAGLGANYVPKKKEEVELL